VQVSGKQINFQRGSVSGSYYNGKFSTTGGDFDVDEVKKEFGRGAMKFAARRYGWTFTEKNGKAEIRKRQ
jgi:hypothetical protein